MDSLSAWLQEFGLERYVPVFAANGVDLNSLRLLTDGDLRELGVLLGHRRTLLEAISQLKGSEAQAPTTRPIQESAPAQEPVSGEAERRQLTVMFCDLVGSTALAQKLDPEELRDLMQAYQRACRDVIARYEGHVAQYLGDGLMVYFGWPQAHEDDAVRAIRAGLEVTEAVSKLTASTRICARVGIHTGVVVVGETGHGDASIPTAAVGDTPNIAARLQALAEPGSVLVSERTGSLARGLFDYADLGTQMLKGITEPVRLFRVVGSRSTESRFEAARSEMALTPMVGREEEIALLLRRWHQAKGGEGQVVLVGGEPGIGKSRLTRVLRERLGQERYLVLRYQCSPYHLNSALYPAISQFERAADFAAEDTPEQKLDKMQAVLAGSQQQMAASAPLIAALLSLPLDRYSPLNLSPQKQKEKTLEALAGQVEALAKEQPLLILYEDAHWIDATSHEALDLLIPRLRDLPVLVIVTYRPEYSPRWTDQAHVTTLGLNRLGRRQGAELVAKLTDGKPLPLEVLDQILAHSDGVPLFIEELTTSVLESKLLREAGDGYVLDAPLPALAIPTTLRDSLIARLDRLAPVREVAQIGACIGREFSHQLLTEVSPLKGERLDDALEQLTKTGLVFRRGTPPEATYTFKHALVQDAAYDSLLKSKRAELHFQIARVLESDFSDQVGNELELLAHHFTQAGLSERAVPYWAKAGQRALRRVALAEAVAHFTTALRVNRQVAPSVQRDRQELDIRLSLGTAHLALLGWVAVEIVRALDPARELATRLGDLGKLFQILDYNHSYYLNRCEFQKVLQINDEVDALARSQNDSSMAAIARFDETITHQLMGNFKRAQQASELMLSTYDPGPHGHLVHTYNYDPKCMTLASGGYRRWTLGYPDQARRSIESGIDLARRLSHAFNLCLILNVSAGTLVLRGETQLARQWIAEALAIADEHAITYIVEVVVPIWDGMALVEQGDWADGYAKISRGTKRWRDAGGVQGVPGTNMMCARALIGLKRFDEARALLDEALELIQQTGHRQEEAEVNRVLGELSQFQPNHDFPAAEAALSKALEVARSQQAKGYELRAAMSLARLWHAQGRGKDAFALLQPVYEWFTEGYETTDLRAASELLDKMR